MTSIRERLRDFTRPLHEQVDTAFGAYALNQREGYRAFLRAHAAAVFPLETMLEAAGVAVQLPDWPQRSRRAALAADLQAMQAGVPAWAPLAPSAGFPALWGALYVLEGSRMGARYLARKVAAAPLQPPLPRAYLEHGERDGLWQSFVPALQAAASPACLDAMQAAAHAAFDVFLQAARRFDPPADG